MHKPRAAASVPSAPRKVGGASRTGKGHGAAHAQRLRPHHRHAPGLIAIREAGKQLCLICTLHSAWRLSSCETCLRCVSQRTWLCGSAWGVHHQVALPLLHLVWLCKRFRESTDGWLLLCCRPARLAHNIWSQVKQQQFIVVWSLAADCVVKAADRGRGGEEAACLVHGSLV